MSGDVTYQALKRLSWLPERDSSDNGSVIAGQDYDNVYITGGFIGGVTISVNAIDNTPIGATTPSTGAFTTLSSTSNLTVGGNATVTGTIGASNFSGSSSGTNTGNQTTTGTTNRITVTNGTTNPTIDISSSYVGQATITTLGTIGTGTWNGTVVAGQYGGTGVANTGKTITIGGNFTTTGAFTTNLTVTGNTGVTLPTSGTLLSNSLTNTHIFVGNGSAVATDVAMSGDATIANTGALTIANNAVTNAKAAQMAANTIKGNNTGSTANAADLTVSQVLSLLGISLSGLQFNTQQGKLTTPTTTTSAGTFVDTGVTVTITPTSASNTVLVRAVVQAGSDTGEALFQLVRNSTPIGLGTVAGSRTSAGASSNSQNSNTMESVVMEWLDNPATTSAVTYKVQFCNASGTTGTVAVNSSVTDTNTATFPRTASTITVCEVHA